MNEDKHSFHEQGFLLFYGLIMGLLVGVWGNLWASVIFDYNIVKSDTSDKTTIALIVVTSILIVLIVILSVMTYIFYKRWRKT